MTQEIKQGLENCQISWCTQILIPWAYLGPTNLKYVTNLKICIRFVFVSDCNLSNFGGPSSKKECDWTQVSRADLKHFLNMLSDPVIKAFHAHDTCCLTSDRYLLAMVFVYFKKAKLEHEEYNRLNFFKALYLGSSLAYIFTKSATTNVRNLQLRMYDFFFYFSKRYNFRIKINI